MSHVNSRRSGQQTDVVTRGLNRHICKTHAIRQNNANRAYKCNPHMRLHENRKCCALCGLRALAHASFKPEHFGLILSLQLRCMCEHIYGKYTFNYYAHWTCIYSKLVWNIYPTGLLSRARLNVLIRCQLYNRFNNKYAVFVCYMLPHSTVNVNYMLCQNMQSFSAICLLAQRLHRGGTF